MAALYEINEIIDHLKRNDISELTLPFLSENQLNSILPELCNNHSVKKLHFSQCVFDQSFELLSQYLRDNKTLEYLSLCEAELNDTQTAAIAASLTQNTTLKGLNLGYNEITNLGVYKLIDALKQNVTLKELNLDWNRIGCIGGYSLAGAAIKNKFNRLQLAYNFFTPAAASKLQEVLTQNNIQSFNLTAQRKGQPTPEFFAQEEAKLPHACSTKSPRFI